MSKLIPVAEQLLMLGALGGQMKPRQSDKTQQIIFGFAGVLALVAFVYLIVGLIISGFCLLLRSLGFNALGWTNLSRLSTASIGCLLVAYCGFYFGESTFISASLLLGAIFPFVYF